MAITEAYAAITGIGSTEWSLTTDTANPQAKTEDACVQVFLDLSALGIGDKFRFRIYEKVLATGTQRIIAQFTFADVQAKPIWASPTLILLHGWDVTMQKLTGNDQQIPFSVREMTQSGATPDPTISSFTPLSGDAGDAVTITGTNFTSATGVKFGTTPASLTIVNPTTINTTVPSGMTPGAYALTVDAFGASDTSTDTFYVATFSGPVTLTSDYNVLNGQIAEWDPYVTTTVTIDNKNFIVGDGSTGTIRMRPNSPSIQHKLRVINVNEEGFVGGGLVPLSTDPGLWIMHEGVMDMQGHARQTWTRATASLSAGQTSFDIPAGHNWQIGDEIVIVPTAQGSATNYDERTITNVVGNTITVAALTFAHPSVTLPNAQVMLPEVLNLTSNVMVEGQDATHRTHMFIHAHNAGPHVLKNVTQRYMGPRKGGLKVLGRWATHIHHGADMLTGFTPENCVVRDSGSHAFVAHATDDITWRRCVAHNNQEASFWWDNDVVADRSMRITYDQCFASKTLVGDLPGHRIAGFEFTANGLNHAATGCIAVGCGTNNQADASGFTWPQKNVGVDGSEIDNAWTFNDCIAHNNAVHGIFTWQNQGQTFDGHPPFNRALLYHNRRSGIRYGAYTFGAEHNNMVTYKNGPNGNSAEMILDGHDDSQFQLNINSAIFDAGGIAPYCLMLDTTVQPQDPAPDLPSHFWDCTFKGYTINAVGLNEKSIPPEGLVCHLIRPKIGATGRDMVASDISVVAANVGNTIKVQRQGNLTAWQWVWNGTSADVTEIPPFA